MMCSGAELKLDTDAAGIMELPEDAPVGAKFIDVIDAVDPVIEINLTPNRADCAGVRGIARDLAAAGMGTLRPMKISVPEGKENFHFDVPVCVSDQFYGWVCGFGGKIEVVSPAEVRDGLRALNERLVKMHQ